MRAMVNISGGHMVDNYYSGFSEPTYYDGRVYFQATNPVSSRDDVDKLESCTVEGRESS